MKKKATSTVANIIRFIESLRMTEGYLQKTFKLLAFQKDILQKLYGTFQEDGTRQYRNCFLPLPRK